MEGRTIVRPDANLSVSDLSRHYSFNGGPDNRPARQGILPLLLQIVTLLQWRAGQSSGQTFVRDIDVALAKFPSMEGRTIVRPDPVGGSFNVGEVGPSMEGRTIVRPDGAAGQGRQG